MKIKLTLIAIAAILFTGCASKMALGKIIKESGKEIKIEVVETSEREFYISSYGTKESLTMAELFYLVSKQAQKKGFNYFALTNAGANNLNGFPINNIKDLHKYVTLSAENPLYQTNGGNVGIGDKPLRQKTMNRLEAKVLLLPDEFKNSYVSVWDVNKTLSDALAVDGNIKVKF